MTGGMMFKGTPGPWVANYDATLTDKDQLHSVMANGLYIVTLLKSGTSIADENSTEAEEEVLANAQLIATAPDLLAALIDVQDFLKRSGYDTKMVKTVIAKALGEKK